MKKIISVLLIILTFTSIGTVSFAEKPETPFNPSVLSSLDNYEEDKFDGTFYYYEAYVEKYSDSKVVIGMDVCNYEDDTDEIVASLYIKDMDTAGDPMRTVESIDFLVDGVVYSYKSMKEGSMSSYVLFNEDTKPLIEALSTATEVSVKIGTDRYSFTIDLDKDEFDSSLKTYCKNILKYSVLDYLVYDSDSWWNTLLKQYPLKIKK